VLAVALGLASHQDLAGPSATAARAVSTGVHSGGLSKLPRSALSVVSGALGRAEDAYRVSPSEGGFAASNPGQRLRLRFSRTGVSIRAGAAHVALGLSAVRYGSSLRAFGQQAPSATGNRVRYARAGLSEWYVNGPLGLEQGFTISRALPGPRGAPLTLVLALSGDARARLAGGGQSVIFTAPGGESLRYGNLLAIDARGRVLPSRLSLARGRLLVGVQVSGASYPLRIDPLVQQGGALQDSEGDTSLGASVALSANGNTALIGAPGARHGAGAAWVFDRAGAVWSQQGEMLTGAGEVGAGQFGASVALSSDGDTAIVGGYGDDGGAGAAWVFTSSGSGWTQQGPKLTAGGEVGAGWLGSSVALSADGDTALLGGSHDAGEDGAAWVFVRSGSSWAQQGEKLTGTGICGVPRVGSSLALSADGDTAIIGGPWDCDRGAAWVFARSGSTWAHEGPKLTVRAEVGKGFFAESLALSADGDTALIGADEDHDGRGAAWVFQRAASNWTQLAGKLTGGGELGKGRFGRSVALSANGRTALVGGVYENTGDDGAAWLFERTNKGFKQQGARITGAGEGTEPLQRLSGGGFGRSVALSGDGTTAVVGGGHGRGLVGRAWVFAEESAAPAVPAEFGRCVQISASAGEPYPGRYARSSCTATGRRRAYEWFAGVVSTHFALSAGSATVETAKGFKVSCTAASGSGEYSASTLASVGDVRLAFSGCQADGGSCTTAGSAEGEIVSAELAGELLRDTQRKARGAAKIGLVLQPATAGALAQFSCGATALTLRGVLVAPLATQRMAQDFELVFPPGASHGSLLASIAGGLPERAALGTKLTLSNEEAVEVRAQSRQR
jgi:hypothetical protein